MGESGYAKLLKTRVRASATHKWQLEITWLLLSLLSRPTDPAWKVFWPSNIKLNWYGLTVKLCVQEYVRMSMWGVPTWDPSLGPQLGTPAFIWNPVLISYWPGVWHLLGGKRVPEAWRGVKYSKQLPIRFLCYVQIGTMSICGTRASVNGHLVVMSSQINGAYQGFFFPVWNYIYYVHVHLRSLIIQRK